MKIILGLCLLLWEGIRGILGVLWILVLIALALNLVWHGVAGTYRALTRHTCPACGN